MTKIVLDAESFKALASDTRLQILKALDARPLTVSELSRLLSLNKATVFEHLKQLIDAELAKRENEPARKWVYYRLTWKGRNVLHPENAQIFLMLGIGALSVGGLVFQTARLAADFLGTMTKGSEGARAPAPPSSPSQQDQQVSQAGSGSPSGSPSPTSAGQTPAAGAPAKPPEEAAPPEMDTAGGSDFWMDVDFWVLLSFVALLLLVGLITWSLRAAQRRERAAVRRLVDGLPRDVNQGEERSV